MFSEDCRMIVVSKSTSSAVYSTDLFCLADCFFNVLDRLFIILFGLHLSHDCQCLCVIHILAVLSLLLVILL